MYRYSSGQTAAQVYDWLMSNPKKLYGSKCHGQGAEELVKGYKSLLDVGCGKTDWAWQQGIKYVAGADIAHSAVQYHVKKMRNMWLLDMTDRLPIDDGTFECVVCFDVLEHIQPEAVEFAISELFRVASKRVVCTVCTKKSVRRGRFDEELHLTVKPVHWWLGQLGKYGKLSQHGRLGKFMVVDL